jgi:hypothetical protein
LAVANGPAEFNVGVFGTASGGTTNWAGYFDGNTFTGGSGIIRARINSDLNAGVALTLNDQPGWSVATVTGGQFQIFNDFVGQNALWIDRSTNNVGIGTTSPTTRLDVLGNINSSTQYNIGGNRVLSNAGSVNLFAGVNAGVSNTGGGNAFFGDSAGRQNTVGIGNSFFGRAAGENSTTGSGNSFFGATAGQNNTSSNNAFFGAGSGRDNAAAFNAFFGYQSGMVNSSGQLNAFFGSGTGVANTTGTFNSFFGAAAGAANVNGTLNSFFGTETGDSNINGHSNSFFGRKAGDSNTSGSVNVFVGIAAGQSNTTGHYNTIVGGVANLLAGDLQFATALGAQSKVGTSDTIVLGKIAGNYDGVARPADTVQIPGDLSVSGTLSLGGVISANTINATTQFNIGNSRVLAANGQYSDGLGTFSAASNTFVGFNAGQSATPDPSDGIHFGKLNSFFGASAGKANTTGFFNSFFGFEAGLANVTGFNNSFLGQFAGGRNVGGGSNTFLGRLSGSHNLGGNSNTAVGENADFAADNATGSSNTQLGSNTRIAANTNSQTAIGTLSRVDAENSTAIGFRARVTQSNSLVLGSISGVNGATANTNVGIGTTAPTERLHVVGNQLISGNLSVNGSISVGGGSTVTQMISGTAALDFPSLASGSCFDQSLFLTGATLGDPVMLGVPNGSVVANTNYSAWVSAANAVTVRLCNADSTASSADPASGTFRIAIIRF